MEKNTSLIEYRDTLFPINDATWDTLPSSLQEWETTT